MDLCDKLKRKNPLAFYKSKGFSVFKKDIYP